MRLPSDCERSVRSRTNDGLDEQTEANHDHQKPKNSAQEGQVHSDQDDQQTDEERHSEVRCARLEACGRPGR